MIESETLDARLDALADRLAANNIETVVVDSGEEARARVLEMVPPGSEVYSAKSKTLEDLGLTRLFDESGEYVSIRAKYTAMDRATQGAEIRSVMADPDFIVGSVQAITEAGEIVAVSYSGSQIGPYASGAGRVVLVVGSQKLVPDMSAAMKRIADVAFPYEDARLREQFGVGTKIVKTLVMVGEARPGRTTVLLVREPLGA